MDRIKLFKKDFTLMVLGQIISLFGNVILRFSLSMFILDKTGSVAIFAGILAISMVPTVLLSTFGGIIADRVNKRNIMVILDFITSILIVSFIFFLNAPSIVIVVGLMMILLAVIQAFYQPSVQSSIPVLVDESKLMSANGIVIQVNALASLLGPIIGGFLYGFFGIFPILIVSGICFFTSAVMECFIKIPFEKRKSEGGIFAIIRSDFKETFHFLVKEQPALLRLLFLVTGINLFLSSMVVIGLPYIIKILMGLSNQLYGFAEGTMGIGSIIGGVLAGLLVKKLGFKKSYWLLLGASISVIPIGISIMTTGHVMLSYAIILICIAVTLCFSTLFSIYAQTMMQKLTPKVLLGKVASLVTVIVICAFPVGQAMYGGLFAWANTKSYLIIFFAAAVGIVIALLSKRVINKMTVE